MNLPAADSLSDNPLSGDLDAIVSRTRQLWEECRSSRIFITGGTGFFGCWLLESFCWANQVLALNAEAWVLTRNPAAFRKKCPHLAHDPGVRLIAGDITDFEFPQGEFPFVIHAATEASATLIEQNPLAMFDTIVSGTRRCLDFARQARTKKFLLTSSGAVYGRQPVDISHVSEEYPGAPDTMNPHWSYGEGKRCAELLCSMYAKHFGIETKIARCWAFVGPYLPLDRHFAIGNFIRDAMAGGPVVIKGDGTPFRSYLYAADLAAWLWTILFKAPANRPYNVGSGNGMSLREVAEAVAVQFTPAPAVTVLTPPVPGRQAEQYVPSVNRARAELGLREETPLDGAISKTIAWMTRNMTDE
jgi:dTDP-glucose 4,6-dehydratase